MITIPSLNLQTTATNHTDLLQYTTVTYQSVMEELGMESNYQQVIDKAIFRFYTVIFITIFRQITIPKVTEPFIYSLK